MTATPGAEGRVTLRVFHVSPISRLVYVRGVYPNGESEKWE